ncbi:histidinol-phosphate aminotransferase [Rhodoblastus acidophilus]|uniref:aminotransferase class I/II-fold pyridoxal phosphate-dependent enzyme n=1 Tax=Rhodoblastus acidophilus TaxID=1074 RepID=UPI00222492D9|nr:aminotransferase class I/II-fold pyridoxal phosphate-dependent enzyme [Rhodoblastus acidophilus]MCW2284110.1 histidinol-phosphate aminotransferase [Rhodoblastus acidophilus]MCW2332806.1 histidinol-phosphate aminotransferase [Rhodoblastus acidophilus]
MDFVTERVAIGDASEAEGEALRRNGIGAVLSLTRLEAPLPLPHAAIELVDRQALSGDDIRAATHFIKTQVDAGRRVLVHCFAGVSRSPAMTLCYLHEHMGFSLDDALARVKTARALADPHPALLASIRAHYGQDVALTVDVSANENPYGPSPLVVEAVVAAAAGAHLYPDGPGDALRNALARRFGVGPQTIVLGNGSTEILEMTARAILAPGKEAIIGWPSFPTYRAMVRRVGAREILVPLVEHDYDLDAIAERISPDTGLVVLGNPNNPTGRVFGKLAFARLLERLPPHAVLCLDEAYCDYASADDFPDSLATVRAGRSVVVVRTFSKAFGMAGLRIGYALAPPDLAKRIDGFRQRFNTSSIAQGAALAALEDYDHVARSAALNVSAREKLCADLAELGLAFVKNSDANFVMIDVGDGVAIAAELKKSGVRVKSLEAIGLPACIRVSVGTPEQNERVVETLAWLQRHTDAAGGVGLHLRAPEPALA